MPAAGESQGLENILSLIREYDVSAHQLSELFRVLAQWQMRGGEEDKVRTLLGDAVGKSKALSVMQEEILRQLSHLLN